MMAASTLPALAYVAAGALAIRLLVGRRGSGRVEPWLAEYERELECSPSPKPGTVALRRFILERWGGGDLGISRECGGETGHQQGSAWDWGVLPGQTIPPTPYRAPARPDEAIAWLLATVDGERAARARNLGVQYLIYDRRAWYAYPRRGPDGVSRPAGSWHPYTGSSAHREHVHFSLTRRGAAGETAGYERAADGTVRVRGGL